MTSTPYSHRTCRTGNVNMELIEGAKMTRAQFKSDKSGMSHLAPSYSTFIKGLT